MIMRLWPRTLRARLTLWYTLLLSGMLALLGVVALVLLDHGLRDNVDASLKSVARSIAESTRGPARFGPDLDDTLESLLGPSLAERFFRLLDPFGRPDPRVGQRGRAQLPLSPEALRNAEDGRETYETLTLPGVSTSPVRLLTLPVIEHGRIVHLVQVAMPLESAETARSRFLFILLGLTPVALGGASAGGWFLARRALAPVDAMVETARMIEAGDLSRRIEAPESNDELGRLAAVLNDMLARLERSFTAVRHFSADAAHELRTPLTILRGELEVALRSGPAEQEYHQVLGSCLEEVTRLSALVEDLLFLARSDSGNLNLARTPLDLAEVFADVVPALRALAETAEVTFAVADPPTVWVRGNRPMLFRLLFNLGENAIKYTPPGGTVEIGLSQDDSVAKVAVRDTGPGIAPEEQARIFDRFHRGDPARERGGTGLGLALARSIVLVHNGQISVESTPGQGSCFSVSLPRLAS
ncbi:MAG TPA: ATP-binding protein [Candidatus Binatia bacterium]|jgi:heavy metal sensor kinase|nr:ATP-binding protein [Candidatus Binatia bacterium]